MIHLELRNNCWASGVRAFKVRLMKPAMIGFLLVGLYCPDAFGQGRNVGPARVIVGKVVKTERSSLQSFVGTLQATRRATIGSAVDGRVTKVDFDAGDPVGFEVDSSMETGVPLVEIRTETLDIEIRAAELQLQQAQQALDELRLNLPRNLELAKANQAGAESQRDYAKANYQRLRKLSTQGTAISQIEVESARAEYQAAQQSFIGASVETRRLESTTELQIAQAESRVGTAEQERFRLMDLRSQYTIRAPFPGVVTQKMTEVGQWVTRGAPLLELVQLDPIEMIVNIPQEYSGKLQESIQNASNTDLPLTVKIDVNGLNDSLAGELLRIIPQADLRSRSFPVRIRIANPPVGDTFKLKPGMLGRASMLIGREAEMLLVKKDALVFGSDENRVFKVVKSNGKTLVVPVVVTMGVEVGSWVQVEGKLTQDDLVVVVGNERLQPGGEVLISETRTEEIDE